MTQLTVRGVDDSLHRFLEQEAERHGLSINRTVLSFLQAAAGLGNGGAQTPIVYHDLDHLAGTWMEEEYEEFAQELAVQRGG